MLKPRGIRLKTFSVVIILILPIMAFTLFACHVIVQHNSQINELYAHEIATINLINRGNSLLQLIEQELNPFANNQKPDNVGKIKQSLTQHIDELSNILRTITWGESLAVNITQPYHYGQKISPALTTVNLQQLSGMTSIYLNLLQRESFAMLIVEDDAQKPIRSHYELVIKWLKKTRQGLMSMQEASSQNTEILFQTHHRQKEVLFYQMVFAGALVVLMMVLIGWHFMKKVLVTPLERLNQMVRQLEHKGFNTEQAETFPIEMMQIALSVEELYQNLRQSMFSKDYLQSIFSSLPVIAIILENDHIQDYNLLTHTHFPMIKEGMNFEDLLIKAQVCTSEIEKAQSLEPGILIEITTHFMGTTRHFSLLKSMLNDKNSQLIILDDITSQTEHEQQLQLAKSAAEEANKAKTTFLSSMSHELRTPLNAIIGFSEILLVDKQFALPPKKAEQVDMILKSGKHLLALVNDILDLSRIEEGRLELSIEGVCPLPVLQECLEFLRPIAIKHGVHIDSVDVKIASHTLMTDRLRFKQIITNLITNAIKYNKPGGIVMIKHKASYPNIEISIVDTGHGIREEDMLKIFSPFTRVSNNKDSIDGVGIGLSVTKTLIEALGGTITVESKVGIGSRFTVTLPLYHRDGLTATNQYLPKPPF